jgi:hypothetical protein
VFLPYRKTNAWWERGANRIEAIIAVSLVGDDWEDRVARRRLSKEQGEAG